MLKKTKIIIPYAYETLKSGVNDISDDEFNLIISPHGDKVNQFVEEYIMPEVIAFYLATGYYGNCMYEEPLCRNL